MLNEKPSHTVNIFEKYYYEKKPGRADKSVSEETGLGNRNSSSLDTKTLPDFEDTLKFTYCFSNYILPYLSTTEFVTFKSAHKICMSIADQAAAKINILSNSTVSFKSPTQRYNIWSHYLKLNEYKEELFKSYQVPDDNNDKSKVFYDQIQKDIEAFKKGDAISYINEEKGKAVKESFEYIKRDVDRTFYHGRFSEGDGRNQLRRVLEALSMLKENVGYCQGMNFIAGALIDLLDSEEKAFYVFSCLFSKYELLNLFAYNTPDYGIRVFQLNYYVEKYFPKLFHHFKNNNLSFDLLYSKWLMTIFSNYIKIEYLDFPWTCFFADKWKGILKFCLVLLSDLEEALLQCDLEGIAKLLQGDVMKYHLNYNRGFSLYKRRFKITNNDLKSLRDEYYISLAKEKLSSLNLSDCDSDQKEPLLNYLKEKDKISVIVKKDILNYKSMMEDVEKKYLITLKKYNNILKGISEIKKRMNVLADEKYSLESVEELYRKEIESLETKKNLDSLKNDTLKKKRKNSGINVNKKELLEKELGKIFEKSFPVKSNYEKESAALYDSFEILDKSKQELEKLEGVKNLRKQQMQNYIMLSEKKENELIKELCEKLKLTEYFKRTNRF